MGQYGVWLYKNLMWITADYASIMTKFGKLSDDEK